MAMYATPAIHPNVECDSCGIVPIYGPRYYCQRCTNFDLCQQCYQRGAHSKHSSFIVCFAAPSSCVSWTKPAKKKYHSSSTEDLSAAFNGLGLEDGKKSGRKQGKRDVTDKYADRLEDLMNDSILDPRDLGRGKDAHGVRFKEFKVNRVRQISMNPETFKQYKLTLEDIGSTLPERRRGKLDTNASWLRKLLIDPSANEVFLFHGVGNRSIAKNSFDEQKANPKGMFGPGIYFAENADKSDQYTGTESPYQMFLARVILGNIYHETGKRFSYKSFRADFNANRYHSVMAESQRKGATNSKLVRHQEFIVYSGHQCLPVFLIDYDRV